MWKTISASVCISIIIVSLSYFFYNQGGEFFLRCGEVAAGFINVFILLMSSDEMEWYSVPYSGKLILNIVIYGIFVFILLKGWQVITSKKQI